MSRGPLGFQLAHHPLKRDRLMCERLEHAAPGAGQQFQERWLARQIAPQGEGVHKHADEIFEVTVTPPRQGGAHDQIGLATVLRQEELERREQRHEQ